MTDEYLYGVRYRRSLTGAWIETSDLLIASRMAEVAPSRERGLKHVAVKLAFADFVSLPHGSVD